MQTVQISYANSPNNIPSSVKDGFHIDANVCGSTTTVKFQLDTGSNGIVMSKSDIGSGYSDYPCFGPGQIHYWPSNIIYKGIWYLLPVTLLNAKSGTSPVTLTGEAMVLVVDGYPSGRGMMGVAGKGQNPTFNIMLNLSTNNAPLSPGYVVSSSVLTVGQTHTPDDNFTIINMQPTTPPSLPNQVSGPYVIGSQVQSWAAPTVNLTIIGPNPDAETSQTNVMGLNIPGSFELDTGIDQVLVAAPAGVVPSSWVGLPDSAGTRTFINGLGMTAHMLCIRKYSTTQLSVPAPGFNFQFTTSDNPPANGPSNVKLMSPPTNYIPDVVRINVGRMPLSKYNYMYDALNGVIGFKAVG